MNMRLSIDKVKVAKEIYLKLPHWNIANECLTDFFCKNKLNTDMNVILSKVALIDGLYRTNLQDPISVAENIAEIEQLDKRLKRGDEDVLAEVSQWNGKKLMSFSSKFCHFHNKKVYPIYDKYVCLSLNLLIDWKNKKEAIDFLEAINKFRVQYGLQYIPYEDVDKYLWLYGQREYLEKGKNKINREVRKLYETDRKLFDRLKAND